ncbi:MAG: hypothetical protein K8R53_07970 [Bacteroidales bacterium]|nr:hypothetical protein [Bacteroidales bacterium]
MMDELRKRKLLGDRLYKIYRRIRYVRYLKKHRKAERKEVNLSQSKAKEEQNIKTPKNRLSLRRRIYRFYRILRFLIYRRKSLKRKKKEFKKGKKLQTNQEREVVRQNIRSKSIEVKHYERQERQKLKEEKKRNRKRRRRLIRYVLKRQSETIINNRLNPGQYYRRRIGPELKMLRANKAQRRKFFVISFNSLVYYILSYLVIHIIGMFVTVWASFQFNYKTILFYYKVYFNIESEDWISDAIKLLYSTEPLTALFLGIIFLIIYSNIRKENFRWKMFFMWGYIHGLIYFFSALLMGTLLSKGIGYVVIYLYYKDTGKLIFALISLFAIIIIGGFSIKNLLFSANIYFKGLNNINKRFFIYSQVIFPVIAGTILLNIIKYPSSLYFTTLDYIYFDILKTSAILFILIPILLNYKTHQEIYFDEDHPPQRIVWITTSILIILIVAFRFGLNTGIHFG